MAATAATGEAAATVATTASAAASEAAAQATTGADSVAGRKRRVADVVELADEEDPQIKSARLLSPREMAAAAAAKRLAAAAQE